MGLARPRLQSEAKHAYSTFLVVRPDNAPLPWKVWMPSLTTSKYDEGGAGAGAGEVGGGEVGGGLEGDST